MDKFQIQKEILELIKAHSTIIIHRHVNPDPDALGSQGGLQHVLKSSFPEKTIYVVGEEVEGLKFLNRMDEVHDEVYKGSLVIVCDTATTSRISDTRYDKGSKLIKIDHHPSDESYGDIEWVDTKYSSASEMIADLVFSQQNVFNMTNESARLLFAGIVGDTGRFMYDNTGVKTFKYAGELLSYGIKPQEIYNEFEKITRDVARLQGHILMNYEATEKGVAYFKVTEDVINQFGVDKVAASNLVNILSPIEGNNIWVFFVQYPDEIRVRIRSKELKINGVAKQFSGGGHPLASGATVKTWEEAMELIAVLDNIITE